MAYETTRSRTLASESAGPVDLGSSTRQVFHRREFLWLSVAQVQSLVGDQIARIALSVLVFEATSSPLLTAGTYGLTYAPAIVGGVLFGHLADRFSRRRVLVVVDAVRALLFAGMALPIVPAWAVAFLVALAVAVGSLFQAAAPVVVADIFRGESLSAAQGLRLVAGQLGTLAGFAAGGAAVAGVGSRGALAINAGTFVLSAALLAFGLRALRSSGSAGPREPAAEGLRARLRTVFGTPRRRELVALAWLVALWIVPEGLAVPYADEHGGGAPSLGLLLAALPLGCVVGAWLLTRAVPRQRRPAAARVLAVATGFPLILTALGPPWWGAALLWTLAGVGTGYQAQIVAELLEASPHAQRAMVMGVVGGGLIAVQGVGSALGGVLAEVMTAAATIGVAGAVGSGAALVAVVRTRRVLQTVQNSQP